MTYAHLAAQRPRVHLSMPVFVSSRNAVPERGFGAAGGPGPRAGAGRAAEPPDPPPCRTIPKTSATAEFASINPTPGPFQPRFRGYARLRVQSCRLRNRPAPPCVSLVPRRAGARYCPGAFRPSPACRPGAGAGQVDANLPRTAGIDGGAHARRRSIEILAQRRFATLRERRR